MDQSLSFEPSINSGLVDQMAFNIKSQASGTYTTYDMKMTVSLKNYPNSTPAIIPLVFNYRECVPFDFNFAEELKDAYYEFHVGDTYPDIDLTIA